MKRKRASRKVWSSRPDPTDPLDPNTSAFAGIKTYTAKSLGTKGILRRKEEIEERYVSNLRSLGNSTRQLLEDLRPTTASDLQDGDDPSSAHTNGDDPMDGTADRGENEADWVDDDSEARVEETVQIRDILAMRPDGFRRKDERTWAHRIHNLNENWRPVLPRLVNAFLRWRQSKEDPQLEGTARSPPTVQVSSFIVEVLDFHTLDVTADIPMPEGCETRAEALVLAGYLGTVPLQPTLAISLKTLELFRCIRLFKASFSVEAFVKLLCHYYCVPYRRMYRTSLSDAFDIYLHIMREVAAGVARCLGRDSPNWRVLHACPPCGYQLRDEPPLKYTRLYAMDGNNSLKRLAPLGGRRVGDNRVFADSDYFLPQSFVNTYANEVRSKPVPPVDDGDNADDDDDDGAEGVQHTPAINTTLEDTEAGGRNTGVEEGDPTDGSAVVSNCTKNWKAAAAEEKKRAWGIFEETGSFASACRHGMILWLADMVRSGELAKYPLAIVSKVLDVLDGPTLGGFDIGCTFEGTVKSSSLGPAFIKSGSRISVNAFHGYSHNYQCQLRNHPNILQGIGLEDLEVMERIFSASNHLAPIVRYASAYRRRVLIDAFFRHWDEEKYLNLGLMLYNNYRQALQILGQMTIELFDALTAIGATVQDLRRYRQEELQYFEQLGEERPEDLHAIAYVELLQELNNVSSELDDTEDRFLQAVPADYTPSLLFLQPVTGGTTYAADTSATRKTETRRRFLRERQTVLTLEVTALEVKLGITNRWQPGDAEYIKVMEYIATRKYQRALGVLQRLVVQRLFELHRLNLAQTGYRVRTHIAKHLQARCRAIRNAVKNYNAAAAALKPPRPPLDWSKVSHMSFVEEFELLSDTRGDLQDKPWRQPLVREAMRIAHRVERAQEEVTRVNVEVRRLHTSILDEHALFGVVLDDLRHSEDIWYGPVLEHCIRRQRVNDRLLVYINKIYGLEGFTGVPAPGQRTGAVFPSLLSQSELRARAVSASADSQVSTLGNEAPAASPSPFSTAATSVAASHPGVDNAVVASSLSLEKPPAPAPVQAPVSSTGRSPSPPSAVGTSRPDATPLPPSIGVGPTDQIAEARMLDGEDDVSDGEDDLEEQATAYADFIASMM